MIIFIFLVALHNYDGSPYGSNPSLPLVTVDCGFGYYLYNPVLDNITADCRIIDSCSSERSIVGVSCGGKQCGVCYLHNSTQYSYVYTVNMEDFVL